VGTLVGPQIALDQPNVKPFEAFAPTRGEVVEDADVVTVFQ
jgi:hypothetical protein